MLQLAMTRPKPMSAAPVMDVARDPNCREKRVASNPKKTPLARLTEPTKATVEAETWARVELRSAVCRTPQQLSRAFMQKVVVEAAATTVQPYPPSGTALVMKLPSGWIGESVLLLFSEMKCLEDVVVVTGWCALGMGWSSSVSAWIVWVVVAIIWLGLLIELHRVIFCFTSKTSDSSLG
jgi:hypothetical protein